MILQDLLTTELEDKDLVWMMKALAGHYGGYEPIDVVREIAEGLPHEIWRLEGPAEGIIITTVIEHPAGKELLIWWLAGKGILKNLYQIYGALKDIARDRDCTWISGAAQNPALGEYCRRKLNVVSQDNLFTIEVNHGRTERTEASYKQG